MSEMLPDLEDNNEVESEVRGDHATHPASLSTLTAIRLQACCKIKK
jgi:hypothetical protein